MDSAGRVCDDPINDTFPWCESTSESPSARISPKVKLPKSRIRPQGVSQTDAIRSRRESSLAS